MALGFEGYPGSAKELFLEPLEFLPVSLPLLHMFPFVVHWSNGGATATAPTQLPVDMLALKWRLAWHNANVRPLKQLQPASSRQCLAARLRESIALVLPASAR